MWHKLETFQKTFMRGTSIREGLKYFNVFNNKRVHEFWAKLARQKSIKYPLKFLQIENFEGYIFSVLFKNPKFKSQWIFLQDKGSAIEK